jgi:hypothetical protein
MIQMIFPNNDAAFQDDNARSDTAGIVHSWFKSVKANFSIFHDQHNYQI